MASRQDPHDAPSAHDSAVSFEEYLYWASLTRAEEKLASDENPKTRSGPSGWLDSLRRRLFRTRRDPPAEKSDNAAPPASGVATNEAIETKGGPVVVAVEEQEWKTASRAMRTAGWTSIFYLIVTDILGPFGTP